MISKSNNNSFHDDTSAFFNVFSEKDAHLNAVEVVTRFCCIFFRHKFINVKVNGVDCRKIFWNNIIVCIRSLLWIYRIFSCIVLLFLSSFVLCSFRSIVNVYGATSDLIRAFFSFSSSLKKCTSLYSWLKWRYNFICSLWVTFYFGTIIFTFRWDL